MVEAASDPDEPRLAYLDPGDGRPRPLRFVKDDGRWVVLGAAQNGAWVETVLLHGGGHLLVGGKAVGCGAVPVTDPSEIARLLTAFRRTYGRPAWLERLEGDARVIMLDPTRPVRAPDPEERLRLEFDAAAPHYHERVESRPVERYLKRLTADHLLRTFAGLDPLLEIGSGSGYETLPLLRAGHSVTAVDVSARMLETLEQNARGAGVADRLTTVVGSLSRLPAEVTSPPDGGYAGACSTFGPFNLVDDLEPVRLGLARALRPDAELVFTSLNRPGVAPLAWELAAWRTESLRGRFRARSWTTRQTFYPLELFRRRPSEWQRCLSPEFRRVHVQPVSVLAPPFNPSTARTWPGPAARALFRAADGRLTRWSGLAEASEWSLLTFRRVPAPSPERRPTDTGAAKFGRPARL